MPNFFSTQVTALATTPPTKIKVNLMGGRIRFSFGQFTNPAASGALIADVIYYTRIPRGSRVLGLPSRWTWSTGAASCTSNMGDNTSAARYAAATAITTAGNTSFFSADTNGAQLYEVSDESRDNTGVPSSTNDSDIRGTIAGANMQASQVVGVYVQYVQD